MTEPKDLIPASLQRLREPLDFALRYPCPVCRHGHIEGLFLVDAFSCEFCRHIFTVDSLRQSLHLEDTAQPLKWRRVGDRWISAHSEVSEVREDSWVLLWGFCLCFVIVPTAMVGLANYIFPPLPSSESTAFPLLWTGLTFVCHGSIVLKFCLEYYQIPVYLIIRLYAQRLFQPLARG
jgi:hypothetical protein